MIRIVTTAEERHAVFRFRYSVYVEEMNRPQPHADHERKLVVEDLDDNATIFALLDGEEIVGTLRVNRVSEGIGKYAALYGLTHLDPAEQHRHGIVTVLMLARDARGRGAIVPMFQAVYAWARTIGIEQCWIDCNDPLVPMFERFGFRSAGRLDHPLYGRVALLHLDMLDEAHLRAVRSPYVAALDNPLAHLPHRSPPVSTLERLKADFAIVADRFHRNPACARFMKGDFTRAEYASLMGAIALQARENPQIQAYATAFFRGHQRDLVRGFLRHATSEIGHDQLAANDVAAMGFPSDDLFEQLPLPSTISLTAFAYYTIDHLDPVAYLGYLFFLEFLPTQYGAQYGVALDHVGVPADARSFLMDHAKVDIGHNKLMEGYIARLIDSEEKYAAVRYAMEVTGTLYAAMITESFARADELTARRPASPWEIRATKAPIADAPESHYA